MASCTSEKLELPVEIWSQVMSFLTDEDIIHLRGFNRAFWNAALDILYGKLDLTENSLRTPPPWRLPSRLFSLPRLNRRLRHFRAHSSTVTSVSITLNIEFVVWRRGTMAEYLFDHVHNWDCSNPCLPPLLGIACVDWGLRTLRRTVLLWPLAVIKPTFWGSVLTARHITSTLACLPNIKELEVQTLPPRPYFPKPNTFRRKKPFLGDDLSYLRVAFQQFGPTLVRLKLSIPYIGLPVLPSKNSLPSLENLSLRYGGSKSASYEFLGCIASSLGASQGLQCVSMEARFHSWSFPSSFEIPLPRHLLPNLRILRLTIENLEPTSRRICEIISRYKEQLEELHAKVGDWIPNTTLQTTQAEVEKNFIHNALYTLFNPSVLTRLSISLTDRPEDMWFATLMTKLNPQVQASTLTHLSLDFPRSLSSKESLAYLPNLLSFTLVINDIYLPFFSSMPINLPSLKTLKVISKSKIRSASDRACFVCARDYAEMPYAQLAKELGDLLDTSSLSTNDWPLVHAEIWVVSMRRTNSETELLKFSTYVFVEPLVRVFAESGQFKDFKFIEPSESYPSEVFSWGWGAV
ncbi:hypothetical protein DL96DRAFT_1606438 [Flagelloscypha sp. PMI_526]|nr:hypothetical protein DL96DRAFT_1606438 [Flagelloscypha sp. PMI_526]